MSDIKRILIDDISLGSNFEIATYKTQRNSGGVSPLRGNGSILASNNFVLDDSVVLNFKVNKSDLNNFIKIYARFKTKGILLVESPILAYKLLGDIENDVITNEKILQTKTEVSESKRSLAGEKYFLAMLGEFNIKSISDSAYGFEIEIIMHVFSDALHTDVVEKYKENCKDAEVEKLYNAIDTAISNKLNAKQDCIINYFSSTSPIESIDVDGVAVEYTEDMSGTAVRDKIKTERAKQETAKSKNIDKNEIYSKKLSIEMFWKDYEISEFELRMSSQIASIPIQGKAKPFKQYIGLGDSYFSIKFVMDENNESDKLKIRELKRMASLKQTDVFTEINFGIANAFDLNSVNVSNIFFTNDDDSDSVIVNIIFSASGYRKEELSFYNDTTTKVKSNIGIYKAYNKMLNVFVSHPKQYKNYVIDSGNAKDSKIPFSELCESYNGFYWQSSFYSNNSVINLLKNTDKRDGSVLGLTERPLKDLLRINSFNSFLETYATLVLFSKDSKDSSSKTTMQNFKDSLFDRRTGKPTHVYENLKSNILSPMMKSMLNKSNNQTGDVNISNAMEAAYIAFYIQYPKLIEEFVKNNSELLGECEFINIFGTNTQGNLYVKGDVIDNIVDKHVTSKNYILKAFKDCINSAQGFDFMISGVLGLDNANPSDSQKSDAKTAVTTAINIMLDNFKLIENNIEMIREVCKMVIKAKLYVYINENSLNNIKVEKFETQYSGNYDIVKSSVIKTLQNKLPIFAKSHIISTMVEIPLMLDIIYGTSNYGYVMIQSAKLVTQYYLLFNNIILKADETLNIKELNADQKQALANAKRVMITYFGKDYATYFDNNLSSNQEFVPKKDYQKYLGIEVKNSLKLFRIFMSAIMSSQAHQTKQAVISKFIQNAKGVMDLFIDFYKNKKASINEMVPNDLLKTAKEDEPDKIKRDLIDQEITDSNIMFKDIFLNDLDPSGKIYDFNDQLKATNYENWFKHNDVMLRETKYLRFVYSKYEGVQKLFNYEYSKMMPNYKITLIQENRINGVLWKRTYKNLNDYVGLDKVVSVEIAFSKETRIKTAVIQLVDNTNINAGFEGSVDHKSPYADVFVGNKSSVQYNSDYVSHYPMLKNGQLIKIELGYLFEQSENGSSEGKLNTEFTGTIVNIEYGKITTIVCNNFAADLAAGNFNVERCEIPSSLKSAAQGLDNTIGILVSKPATRIVDSIQDKNDSLANSKSSMNYNEEFIPQVLCLPYQTNRFASNFSVLAEAIRKQKNNIDHLNNSTIVGVYGLGSLSNEKHELESNPAKFAEWLASNGNSLSKRIYENINNTDVDNEIYGNFVTRENGFKEEQIDQNAYVKLPRIGMKVLPNDDDTTLCPIIYGASPFCKNNFYNFSATEKDLPDNTYRSDFQLKNTNVYNVLNVIEKRLPDTFWNVIEYGDYGTLFYGRPNYNIMLKTVEDSIDKIDVENILFKSKLFDFLKNNNLKSFTLDNLALIESSVGVLSPELLGKFDVQTQKAILNQPSVKENKVIYKNSHTIISGKNLVNCNIQVNGSFCNTVHVDYNASLTDVIGGLVNGTFGGANLKLYSGLKEGNERKKTIDIKQYSPETKAQAMSIAQSFLREEVENIYSGEIVALYIPNIKYMDEVNIQDYENKIFGTVVVKDFKHIFSKDGAFTIITPMMKVEINSLSKEMMLDSFWTQLFFSEPKDIVGPSVINVSDTLSKLNYSDAVNKPIIFKNACYELTKKTKDDDEGTYKQTVINMNQMLPLKVFPLLKRDTLLMPDLEDYGSVLEPIGARIWNFFGGKIKAFNYYTTQYNWQQAIALWGKETMYNIMGFSRNWYDYDGEAIRFLDENSSIFSNDPVSQAVASGSTGTFIDTVSGACVAGSKVRLLGDRFTNSKSTILSFNPQDHLYIPSTYETRTIKNSTITYDMFIEKNNVLGDLAAQTAISSFIEIYAKDDKEANIIANTIKERANATAKKLGKKDSKFEIGNVSLLYDDQTMSVYSDGTGKWIKKPKVVNKYYNIISSALFSFPNHHILNSVLTTIQSKSETSEDEVTNYREYSIMIYDSSYVQKALTGHRIISAIHKSNGDKKDSKKTQRNVPVVSFIGKAEKNKGLEFSVAAMHNYYGVTTDPIIKVRKMLVYNALDKLRAEIHNGTIKNLFLVGDFNLNLASSKNSESEKTSELYELPTNISPLFQYNLGNDFIVKTSVRTTVAGQKYDKLVVNKGSDKYITQSDAFPNYIVGDIEATKDVSDHYPIVAIIYNK